MTQAGKVLYRNAKKVLQQFTLLEEQIEKAKNNQVELNIEYASIVNIQSLNLLLKGKNQPDFTLHKVVTNRVFELVIVYNKKYF